MPPAPNNDDTTQQIKSDIESFLISKNLKPQPDWLANFIAALRPGTPIQAHQKTALFRVLAADLTVSVQASATNVLPVDIATPGIIERQLEGPIIVQVLDVEDIGRSQWSQVEAMEMEERGETKKGSEVIRVVPDGDDGISSGSTIAPSTHASSGPHKLLLQDITGRKCYAFEKVPIEGISVMTAMGAKLVLRRSVVARGVILLDQENTEVLGGKIDQWDREWRAQRKERLKASVQRDPN